MGAPRSSQRPQLTVRMERHLPAVRRGAYLATIRAAHAIAVLEKGRLRELGSFDELLGRPGLFA